MKECEYECKMISKLKDQVSGLVPPEFTDNDFLKWLQEFDFNLEYIVPNLRQYFRILRSYDFSKLSLAHEFLNEYYPNGFIDLPGRGENRDHFIFVENLGLMDGVGISKSVSQTHIYLHRIYMSEYILKIVRKHEKESGRRTGVIYVYDMKGGKINAEKLRLFTGSYMLICKFFVTYYSMFAEKIIVVNSPMLSSTIYNLIKPIMPEKVRNKLEVLGSNWKTEILKFIDADILPVYYGGNLIDDNNDPKCSSKITYAVKVPLNLYWRPSKDDPTIDEYSVLTVEPGRYEYITVVIEEIDTVLKWFYSTDNDWGFGVFYTEHDSDQEPETMEMVFPQICHLKGPNVIISSDKIICKKLGFYKLWFNNAFSYFSKLRIKYKIEKITQNCVDDTPYGNNL